MCEFELKDVRLKARMIHTVLTENNNDENKN